MINPFKLAKKGLENFVDNHPLFTVGAVLYLGTTAVVNTAYYSVEAGIEGVERACGVSSYTAPAVLKKKVVAKGPHGESMPYGIFQTRNGEELTLVDSIVVTEGKLLPGVLRDMKPNTEYNVEIFGSPKFVQRIVSAEALK